MGIRTVPTRKPPEIEDERGLFINGSPVEGLKPWYESIKKRYRTELESLKPGESPAPLFFKRWTTWRIGKGRAIRVSGFRDNPDFGYAQTRYEYLNAILAKALLWACPKEKRPDVRVVAMRVEAGREPAEKVVVCKLKNRSERSIELRLTLIVRTAYGFASELGTWKRRIPGDGELGIRRSAKLSSTGGYFFDIIAESSRGKEAWGSAYVEIPSADLIKEIRLKGDYAEVGEKIEGEVVLGEEAKGKVVVELVDTFGRRFARRVLEGREFAFKVEPGTTQVVRVRCTLEGDRLGETKEAIVGVPRRGEGEFNFIMWDTISGVPGYWARWLLWDTGFTAQLSGPRPQSAILFAMNNLMSVVYSTHLKTRPRDEKTRKRTSFNNESARRAHIRAVVENCYANRRFGCLAYSLGDEVPTRYVDATGYCQKAYRKYLRKVYGSIQVLSVEWGEKFRSFDEIKLLKEGDAWENEALRQARYARRFHRQAFAHWNMLQICREFGEAFRTQLNDPKGRWGYEGAGGFGDDIDEILDAMRFWGPYPGFGNELLRSLAPKDFLSSNWFGYATTSAPLIRKFYNMVRSGLTAVALWRIDQWRPYKPFIGFLAPSFNFHPAVKELLEETKWVREGGGTLLMQLRRPHGGIAFFYSVACALSDSVEQSSRFNDHRASSLAWDKVTKDLGFQYKFITGKRIASGQIERRGYPILVMPFA